MFKNILLVSIVWSSFLFAFGEKDLKASLDKLDNQIPEVAKGNTKEFRASMMEEVQTYVESINSEATGPISQMLNDSISDLVLIANITANIAEGINQDKNLTGKELWSKYYDGTGGDESLYAEMSKLDQIKNKLMLEKFFSTRRNMIKGYLLNVINKIDQIQSQLERKMRQADTGLAEKLPDTLGPEPAGWIDPMPQGSVWLDQLIMAVVKSGKVVDLPASICQKIVDSYGANRKGYFQASRDTHPDKCGAQIADKSHQAYCDKLAKNRTNLVQECYAKIK